jgi:hypothetical protein
VTELENQGENLESTGSLMDCLTVGIRHKALAPRAHPCKKKKKKKKGPDSYFLLTGAASGNDCAEWIPTR